jgi:hypothetical protein
LHSQSTFSPAGGGKGKTIRAFFSTVWLTIAVLSFAYLVNNFVELNRFIEGDICLVLEER